MTNVPSVCYLLPIYGEKMWTKVPTAFYMGGPKLKPERASTWLQSISLRSHGHE